MVSHKPAPYQHCKVSLVPDEGGSHVGIAFFNGLPFELTLGKGGGCYSLSTSLPQSKGNFCDLEEVVTRMRLVGRLALSDPSWLDVGIDFDGEVRFCHRWGDRPDAQEVDRQLATVFRMFEAYGDALLHAHPLDYPPIDEASISQFD